MIKIINDNTGIQVITIIIILTVQELRIYIELDVGSGWAAYSVNND